MSRVRSKNTQPEMTIRRIAYALGYRYRLHGAHLPGTPDLVFSTRRKVVFVHGCFWHQHRCPLGRVPKSRLNFWLPKFQANQRRDRINARRLRQLGWHVLVVWECQLSSTDKVRVRLIKFLGPSK